MVMKSCKHADATDATTVYVAHYLYCIGRPLQLKVTATMLKHDCDQQGGSCSPERVISRPAASVALPTSALASRKARASMGPDGGTPTCHTLVRPG